MSVSGKMFQQAVVYPYGGVLLSSKKEHMQHQLQQPRWISQELSWMEKKKKRKRKRIILRRLPPVWFHLYNILEVTLLQEWGTYQWWPGVRRAKGTRDRKAQYEVSFQWWEYSVSWPFFCLENTHTHTHKHWGTLVSQLQYYALVL